MSNIKLDTAKLFLKLSREVTHNIKKNFIDAGITLPQGMLIAILFHKREMKVSELSKNLGLSNSTVSGIIDRLEKQKIVKRVRSKDDKRIVYVSLCTEFENVHENFHKLAEKNLEKLLDNGTDEEIQKILAGLNVLKKILGVELRDY